MDRQPIQADSALGWLGLAPATPVSQKSLNLTKHL